MDPDTSNKPPADAAPAAVEVHTDYAGKVRAAWEIAKPACRHLGAVVTEINYARLIGEGGIFERGTHVPFKNMGLFKPPSDALMIELR